MMQHQAGKVLSLLTSKPNPGYNIKSRQDNDRIVIGRNLLCGKVSSALDIVTIATKPSPEGADFKFHSLKLLAGRTIGPGIR